jgi:hypothetical protein
MKFIINFTPEGCEVPIVVAINITACCDVTSYNWVFLKKSCRLCLQRA